MDGPSNMSFEGRFYKTRTTVMILDYLLSTVIRDVP